MTESGYMLLTKTSHLIASPFLPAVIESMPDNSSVCGAQLECMLDCFSIHVFLAVEDFARRQQQQQTVSVLLSKTAHLTPGGFVQVLWTQDPVAADVPPGV